MPSKILTFSIDDQNAFWTAALSTRNGDFWLAGWNGITIFNVNTTSVKRVTAPTLRFSTLKKRFLSLWTEEGISFFEETGYSEQQEREANRQAVELLIRAGYDPCGLLRFLKRINGTGAEGFKRTHPVTTDQIEELEKDLKKRNIPDGGSRLPDCFIQNVFNRYPHL